MGWIEKLKLIKDRIFGTKTKMLNEKNENTNITKVDLNIPKTIEKYKINYQINPNTPESAIEQYLMALLYRRYSIQEQKSRNGEVDFYHIFKGKQGKTVNRLYLNCKRETRRQIIRRIL